jgi:predicted Zn-ribbon and HTH transcriptional regulator
METIRQQIIVLLIEKEMSARELSQAIGIREKEVYKHLPHIARSVAVQKQKLIIQPAQCLGCGYVFKERKRFTRPSRCPRCKKSHLDEPRYLISRQG